MKCERPPGEKPYRVKSLTECQEKAERQHRNFMNYNAKDKYCFSSVTCNRPEGPTSVPWQSYQRNAPQALIANTVVSDMSVAEAVGNNVSAADSCIPGVCTYEPQPAFFYHASSSSCREECEKISACTYYSYCPEANPECSGSHANRCAIFEKCTADDVRAEIPGFEHAGNYLSCARLRAAQDEQPPAPQGTGLIGLVSALRR
jgi:hypothetical protein